jgi:phage terminase large subunit GpA-like protein
LNPNIDFFKKMNNMKTTNMPEALISEFITKTRVMPPGTPIPGPVDLRLTPHVIEWLDNMSPYSPIQHQAILKAAQIAATMASECIIGYWMKEQPTAIMYLSATQSLLEKWATKRLEPMIDSIGMREKIIEFADNVIGKKSRRTGDKVFSKQFVGGFLEMASAQSPASQRSDSIRVMIRDEIDGAPTLLTTGEGNWLNTSAARLKFWGSRKKITDLSTPTTYDLSNIYPLYEDGDRRHRLVPCPHCGKMQPLDWLPESGTHGLRGETTAGILTDVFYLCSFCHEGIFDIEKYDMFNAGKWEPTSTSIDPTFRSYYINSLYSPPGTVSWKDYYQEWYNAKDDPDKMRGFTNLYGGMPYKETGTRPKLESVIELKGAYKSGTAPNEVLYITGAADVQRGKVMYEQFSDEELETEMQRMLDEGKNLWVQSLPRIELEIVGHSQLYRTHSIEYKIFYGNVSNPYGGAWQKLREWLENTGLEYRRVDGTTCSCNLILIDSVVTQHQQYTNFAKHTPELCRQKVVTTLKKILRLKVMK